MTLWYTARGAGLAALVALSAATALGALVSMPSPNPARRIVVQYAHRAAAVLGLALLAVHITAILADAKAHVGILGALIPFQSSYRPGSVAFGSVCRVRVPRRGRTRPRPRATCPFAAGRPRLAGAHALAYLGWAAAIIHGFRSGTDVGQGWVDALFLVCLVGVLAAITARLVSLARRDYVRRAMVPIQATR